MRSVATVDVDDTVDPIEFAYAQGWGDGLPVVPPTLEKVEAAVAASGRGPDDVVYPYPERQRAVTVAQIATCAVMAGCLPEYLPVVLALVEATGGLEFGRHAPNAATGGSAVGFVVNGPVRNALGMNYRGNVLGPGNRANSTIGRALRLTQIDAFGSVPGAGNEASVPAGGRPILDRSTIGQPAKYAGYHVVENEEDFPSLLPVHVERGFAAGDSVVTAFPTAGHMQIVVHSESTARETIDTLSHYLVGWGRFTPRGSCLLIIPPEKAAIFVRDGWSKQDIREAIFEGTSRSVAWAKQHGESVTGGGYDRRGSAVEPGDEKRMISVAGSPDDIVVTVAGGPAGAFVHALMSYAGGFASRKVQFPKESQG